MQFGTSADGWLTPTEKEVKLFQKHCPGPANCESEQEYSFCKEPTNYRFNNPAGGPSAIQRFNTRRFF